MIDTDLVIPVHITLDLEALRELNGSDSITTAANELANSVAQDVVSRLHSDGVDAALAESLGVCDQAHWDDLNADSRFLEALQSAGVDNWEGIDYAYDILRGKDSF